MGIDAMSLTGRGKPVMFRRAVFAVLALAHIVAIFLFWGWK